MVADEVPAHPFHVGFAISVYQNSGDPNSQWAAWERRRTLLGRPTIAGGDRCRESTDFWNRYAEDIERAAALGSNCFRLSLEWSRLEPARGHWDADAAARYHAILDALAGRGLEPHVTLHHFVHPAWFEAAGEFTRDEGVADFVRYARACFAEFGGRVRFWATFNEVNVCSFAGYVHGSFPPGRVAQVRAYGRRTLAMLRAHAEAYDAIKGMPGGRAAAVGIVHNWFTFAPYRGGCCSPPYLGWLCGFLNRMWGNDTLLTFLATGVFDFNPLPWLGPLARLRWARPGGPPGCDFFGLNYYSRGVMDWKLQPRAAPGETMTDMPYALWPEGLALAVHEITSRTRLPLYVTETGVADAGDAVRPAMIQSYMAALEECARLGYDVRGVMYWTLVDNFEWQFGFSMKFGVYGWEQGGGQARRLKGSGALLKQWFEALPRRVAAHRAAAAAARKRGAADAAGAAEGERAPALAAA